jgi:RNA polymerase sigma factor (sigma-70 family)
VRQAAQAQARGDRLSAVPSIGRAARIESRRAAGAETTSDLFERFSGQIFGYCLHQLGSREEAEDAVQTTFMNAFRGLQRGIVPKVESAWLFKIAHNVCLSRRRSSFRRGRVEAPNNLEVLQEIVPAQEQAGDELIRLQDVLEQMPESQRHAILLREWQGLSYREIAEELGLTQAAVETLIFRARRALAAGLEDEPAERSRWGRRARHGVDAGGVLAAAKALLGGGAAKVALTAAAVATSAAVTVSVEHHNVPADDRSAAPVVAQPAAQAAVARRTTVSVPFRMPAHPLVSSTRRSEAVSRRQAPATTPKQAGDEEDAPPALPPAAATPPVHAAPVAAERTRPTPARGRGHELSKPSRSERHVQQVKPKHVRDTTKPSPANAEHGSSATPGAKAPDSHHQGK